ncbi:MAG: dienelactone hydrolase family protein [Bryobacteraceae bacterium]
MRASAASLLLVAAAAAQTLPGTRPLIRTGDLAMDMVASIDRYLDSRLAASATRRPPADPASRDRLRHLLGVVDPRPPFDSPVLVAASGRAQHIRWPALDGVEGEGVLLRPAGAPKAHVIVLPDAGGDPQPEYAWRLAANGALVLIPYLIDRADTWSVNPAIGRATNQPHREFIHRMAYEMGRHLAGYEVQKVLAAVDWFTRLDASKPIGVFGYGEGGLVGLMSAALDQRIKAAVVSGYFNKREDVVWSEPIYRNVWSQLETWGDAELAMLAKAGGRTVIVEASPHPRVDGPPPERDSRRGAAPGRIVTPAIATVRAEAKKANVPIVEGGPGSPAALRGLLESLGAPPGDLASATASRFAPSIDTHRQFRQLVDFTQRLMREFDPHRAAFVSGKSADQLRQYFWEESQGRMPPAAEPLSAAQSRLWTETPKWRAWQVVIPVWGEVYAYGLLLVPRNLRGGERRPVVVTQHGLEGRPEHLVKPEDDRTRQVYKQFAAELADQGYIVFAPQNPYIGQDAFRVLMRKGNPVKLSLFSFIIGQHDRILDWLETLPWVDPKRIGFYGLSYGGKTAIRVPAVVTRYALSICSGDFNQWIWKVASEDAPFGYMYTVEYDMLEFDLGPTFNYAEMANQLIAPRPFMVERGHRDGVGIDEWVSHEYAKVRRHYVKAGIGDRTAIEFFDGPHQIHGVGTYEFLRRWLGPIR